MPDLLLQLLALFWFVLAVLLWGGVHPNTSLWLLGGTASTLLAGLFLKNIRWRMPRPLFLLMLIMCLILIIQAVIFWPTGLVSFLAPANYDLLNYLLKGADGLSPKYLPISLTPGETLFSLVRTLVFFIYLIILSAFFGHRSQRRFWPLWLLGSLGALSALMSLLLAGALPDFSARFYPPGAVSDALFPATFINSNFQAAFYSLALFASLALALYENGEKEQKIWGGSLAALSLLGLILTASRAAIITTAIGLIILAFIGHKHLGKKGVLSLILVTLLSLPAAWSVGAYRLQKELKTLGVNEFDLSGEKIASIPEIWNITKKFWQFGAGSEALATLYPQYVNDGREALKSVSYAENIFLDLPLKFGIPASILILALGTLFLWQFFRRRHLGASELTILIGLLAWFIHNLADFNWRSPAIMMAIAIFLSILITARRRRDVPGWYHPHKALLAMVILLAFISCGLAIKAKPYIPRQYDALWQTYITSGNSEALKENLQKVLHYAPADGYAYTLMALSLTQRGEKEAATEALHYVNRALFLWPKNWFAHYTAGHALNTLGHREQAFLELRLALENAQSKDKKQLINMLWRAGQGKDILINLGAESDAETQRILLTALLELNEKEALKEAFIRYNFAATAQTPSALQLSYNIGERLNDAAIRAFICEKSQKILPDSYWTKSCRAMILADSGSFDEAINLLKPLLKTHPSEKDALYIIRALARIAQKSANSDLLTTLMTAPAATVLLSDLYYKRGLIYQEKGDFSAALRDFQFAINIKPDSYAWHHIGLLREKSGHFELARLAFQKMLEYHPEYRPAQEALRRLSQAIDKEKIKQNGSY